MTVFLFVRTSYSFQKIVKIIIISYKLCRIDAVFTVQVYISHEPHILTLDIYIFSESVLKALLNNVSFQQVSDVIFKTYHYVDLQSNGQEFIK